MKGLTLQRLSEVLDYDPITGSLTWKVDKAYNAKAGMEAGTTTSAGYRQVYVDGVAHQAHRLIFMLMTGRAPTQVDHKNGKRSDNRWDNLREVTPSVNAHNRTARGTHYGKRQGKWEAGITVNYKRKHLGYFDTEEEARQAYLTAKKLYHPECVREQA